MAKSNDSQGLGLYVHASSGLCSIRVNDYNLYEDRKKGHSFSSRINCWVNEGTIPIEVTLSPDGQVFEVKRPRVELFLHSGDGNEGLIFEHPDPTAPTREQIARRLDQSIERTNVVYEVSLTRPPFGAWLSEKQPWSYSEPSTSTEGIFDLYRRIEEAFISANKEAILELAEPRIEFASKRLQQPMAELRAGFESDIEKVTSGRFRISRCIDPRAQLRLFPVKKGLVYRIEWASGMSAIHTEPDERQFQQGFQVYAANVRGKWLWIF